MNTNINVKTVIQSELADNKDKGNFLCSKISDELKLTEGLVILDFEGITLINTAFLNDAIGSLFGKFDIMEVTSRLRVKNIENDDIDLFKEVLKNAANQYFKLSRSSYVT